MDTNGGRALLRVRNLRAAPYLILANLLTSRLNFLAPGECNSFEWLNEKQRSLDSCAEFRRLLYADVV
jgi:hypothetical protein